MVREADLIEQAIAAALARGLRTADIFSEGTTKVGTKEMGAAIREEFRQLAVPDMTRIYENSGFATPHERLRGRGRHRLSLSGAWELWSMALRAADPGDEFLFAALLHRRRHLRRRSSS